MDLDLNNTSNDVHGIEEEKGKSFFTRGVAFLFAIGLTAALLAGYMFLRWRHAERMRKEQAAQTQPAKPAPVPVLQVFLDDAMIKGSSAVLGGTLVNISKEKLTGLSVELELKRRKDGSSEMRTINVEPRDLEPEQQGRYSLSVPSGEYRESRVLQIKSDNHSGEMAFKTAPGAQRPPERLPQTGKTIIVKPAPSRGKGEEFINTPDNPVRVP
jgi:hypothetical protein